MKFFNDTLKHSAIALLLSVILSGLINWFRTMPNVQGQMGWFGVVICLMLTINYIRNWRLKYDFVKPVNFKKHIKQYWAEELMHFIVVNAMFIIPLVILNAI